MSNTQGRADTGPTSPSEPPPGAVGPAVIDAGAIARLHELDPSGAQGVVQRVLSAYHGSLERHLSDIAAAALAGDGNRLVHSVHTLKSSSAAVGALDFSSRCADAEHRIRNDRQMPDAADVEALIHEGRRVLAAVGAMLPSR